MTIDLAKLARRINPSETILFFGAGSSMPSGLPGGNLLRDQLCKHFDVETSYSLTEASQIVEDDFSRRDLIGFLRDQLGSKKPTGGLLNLPNYDWPSIFTTNFDKLIEGVYERSEVPLHITDSNFDFGTQRDDNSARLFKLHGTIEKNVIDGSNSRIIVTDADYDLTSEYREMLWTRLKADLAENDCIIIGYSLADEHIRDLLTEIANLKSRSYHRSNVYILSYEKDER